MRSSGGSRSGSGSSSGLTTSTNASSSELSCDTVVFRGYSDTGSDGEHPPPPRLHGSLDDIPRPSSRRRKILTNGAISPRQCLSPQPCLTPRSPASGARSSSSLSGRCLPAIPEVVNSGKMPLSGLVPVQSSHRLRQLQQGKSLKSISFNLELRISVPQNIHSGFFCEWFHEIDFSPFFESIFLAIAFEN